MPATMVKSMSYGLETAGEQEGDVLDSLKKSSLFSGMSAQDIMGCLSCSASRLVSYDRGETVFDMYDVPTKVHILISGEVTVGKDTADGRRNIMRTFDRPGDLFGEVYLFVGTKEYGHWAEATEPSRIMEIPKDFLYHTCGQSCSYHSRLISNTMQVLAQKAYYLDQRLSILTGTSLREKIAKVLLQNENDHPGKPLSMTRERLAEYIATTRPSVSRELMNMQSDGLVDVRKEGIYIRDYSGLELITGE